MIKSSKPQPTNETVSTCKSIITLSSLHLPPLLPNPLLSILPLHSHPLPLSYLHIVHADVTIDVPLLLDLSHLRGRGLQEGEVELPEGEAPNNQQEQQSEA